MYTMYLRPRSLPSFEIFPARLRSGVLLRSLVLAVVAIVAVTGARLLGEHGVSAPLPCGESLAACVGP
jgi:hypothetical protein